MVGSFLSLIFVADTTTRPSQRLLRGRFAERIDRPGQGFRAAG
jgi:hypothetical protein